MFRAVSGLFKLLKFYALLVFTLHLRPVSTGPSPKKCRVLARLKRPFHAANDSLPRSISVVADAHQVAAGGGRLTPGHSPYGRGQTRSFAFHHPAASMCMCLLCKCVLLFRAVVNRCTSPKSGVRENTALFHAAPSLQARRRAAWKSFCSARKRRYH